MEPPPLDLRPVGLRVFAAAGLCLGIGLIVWTAVDPVHPSGESARFVDYFAIFVVVVIQLHVTWRAGLHPRVTAAGQSVVIRNPVRTFVVPVTAIVEVHPRHGMTIETSDRSIECWAFSPSIVGRRRVVQQTRALEQWVENTREGLRGDGLTSVLSRWDVGAAQFAVLAASLAILSFVLSR